MSVWDPGSWWGAIENEASSIGDNIRKFVKHAISSALNLVMPAILGAFNFLDSLTQTISDGMDFVSKELGGAWDSISNIIVHDIPDALDSAVHLAGQYTSYVLQHADDIARDALNYYHDAEQGITDVWSSVVATVVDPFAHWVASEADRFGHDFAHWWDVFFNDAIRPVEQAIDDALKVAEESYDWIEKEGRDAVHLVEQSWDWLTVMAVNPKHVLEDMINGAEDSVNLAWIMHAADGADNLVDGWLDDAARLLR